MRLISDLVHCGPVTISCGSVDLPVPILLTKQYLETYGYAFMYTGADSLCEMKENIFGIFFKYEEENPNTTSNTLN
jgi:hypothetical protein